MLYTIICLIFVGSGSAILYFFSYEAHPEKAVLAIALIAFGLFLLAFRRKGADDVRETAEAIDSPWWSWW